MGSSADADFDSHGAVRAALTRSYNRPPRGSSEPERSAPSQPRTNPPARTIDMMASSAARPLAWVNRVANGRVRTRHRARHPFEKLHFVLFFLNGKARVNVGSPRPRPSVRPSRHPSVLTSVFPPSTSHQPQDAGLARNRRAAPSTPTRAPSLSVSAIFNFGQDNKTSEDTKQEAST